jgi:Tfp pilus assembly pilus retraction ATPase PilT
MYSMDNLLTLIRVEEVRELQIRAGVPPIVVSENESHMLEGPPLTAEGTEQLLRSIANTRQMRALQQSGAVEFMYHFEGRSPFLIRAKARDGALEFTVE